MEQKPLPVPNPLLSFSPSSVPVSSRLWSAAACEEFSLICPSCLPSDPPLRAGDALPAGDRREVDLVHRVGAVGAALAGGWRRRTAVVAGARRRVAVVPAHLALLCVKMENGQKHQKGFGKLEGGAPKYWGATPQAENVFCIQSVPTYIRIYYILSKGLEFGQRGKDIVSFAKTWPLLLSLFSSRYVHHRNFYVRGLVISFSGGF